MLSLAQLDYYNKHLDKIILLQRNIHKMCTFKKNIKYQLSIFLKHCDKIVYNINRTHAINVITYLEYNNIITSLKNIISKINAINMLPLRHFYKVSNYKLLINIIKLKLEIIDIINNYGSKYILDILDFNYNLLSQTNKTYLNDLIFYNEIYICTRVCIYNCKDNVYTLKKQNNIDISQEKTIKLSNMDDYPKTEFYDSDILFYKIHGSKIYIPHNDKIICLCGYFINDTLDTIKQKPKFKQKYTDLYLSINKSSNNFHNNYLNQLSLRDFIIFKNTDIFKKMIDSYNNLQNIRSKPILNLINEFVDNDVLYQRYIIIILGLDNDIICSNILYLLIDLLKSNDVFNYTEFFNFLPIYIKNLINNLNYKLTNKKTIVIEDMSYEKKLSLINCSDVIRSKASIKLKEFNNSKNGEINSKAQHYLDGFINIPFNINKELLIKHELIILKDKCSYYNIKILNYINIHPQIDLELITNDIKKSINNLDLVDQNPFNFRVFYSGLAKILNQITDVTFTIQSLLKNADVETLKGQKVVSIKSICEKLAISKNGNKGVLIERILATNIKYNMIDSLKTILNIDINHKKLRCINSLYLILTESNTFWIDYDSKLKHYFKNIDTYLDESVYGLEASKKEIKRIIAQWVNGANSGYVIGLEGPPGIGKTTLAKKGISKCLIDSENKQRPFIFISVGGSANGTTLEGHNYTYVGSTWGKIVDGLMESKCMNPIIYIDELDKISNTAQGKEIIGILTHLTDSSQNDQFTDKYFSGIPIDLSKALIIFSYNDYNAIDKILIDRIHRIKIEALTLYEKIVIVKDYILPELLTTIGLNKEYIVMDESTIKHLIITYTCEAGVRKLKEKLYEILREINLNFLRNSLELPVIIDIGFIDTLFQNHSRHIIKKINTNPRVGVINGLYASTSGIGGITIIEVFKKISSSFLQLELTGHQGDVMKESMSVARTLAWNMLTKELQDKITLNKNYGIHIHCPDTSTSKDGPSAGVAITLGILSLLTGLEINNKIAITGEIDLNGNAMKIGGLEAKVDGAKQAGVNIVLCPLENSEDLEKIRTRDFPPENDTFKIFTINTLLDAIDYVFDKSIYKYLSIN